MYLEYVPQHVQCIVSGEQALQAINGVRVLPLGACPDKVPLPVVQGIEVLYAKDCLDFRRGMLCSVLYCWRWPQEGASPVEMGTVQVPLVILQESHALHNLPLHGRDLA